MEIEAEALEPTTDDGADAALEWTRWAAGVERSIDALTRMIHVVGASTLGTNLLLAHWMARSQPSGATEDDLAEALRAASADAWRAQLLSLGLAPLDTAPASTRADVAPETGDSDDAAAAS